MALHMQLMVNDQQIGYLVARRISPERPTGNDICQYEWKININGITRFNLEEEPIRHRFGDGAWALVAKIVAAAGLDVPMKRFVEASFEDSNPICKLCGHDGDDHRFASPNAICSKCKDGICQPMKESNG